jgi:hypothetical protein
MPLRHGSTLCDARYRALCVGSMPQRFAATLLLSGFFLTGGCASAPIAPSAPPPLAVLYNGENRLVTPVPIESLQPGDEVVLRDSAGKFSIGIIASRRAPGVYRLRHLDLKLLSADNYAGRLLDVAALTREALAARNERSPAAGPGAAPSPVSANPGARAAAPAPATPAIPASPTSLVTPPAAAPRAPIGEPAAARAIVAPAPVPVAADLSANKPAAALAPGFYDDLLKLEDLRQKGILTDAEFQSAKQRVLQR